MVVLKNQQDILAGCIKGDRASQETLYREYYNYAMTICLPYANTDFEAEEMANDGFMKVFAKISSFDLDRPFTPWLRRIMINSSIDHIRSQRKHYMSQDIDTVSDVTNEDISIVDEMTAGELMEKVRELPQAYRTAFMLYEVEGYKHHEIADQLGIAEGTSKSNLAKAKAKLRESLKNWKDHG